MVERRRWGELAEVRAYPADAMWRGGRAGEERPDAVPPPVLGPPSPRRSVPEREDADEVDEEE